MPAWANILKRKLRSGLDQLRTELDRCAKQQHVLSEMQALVLAHLDAQETTHYARISREMALVKERLASLEGRIQIGRTANKQCETKGATGMDDMSPKAKSLLEEAFATMDGLRNPSYKRSLNKAVQAADDHHSRLNLEHKLAELTADTKQSKNNLSSFEEYMQSVPGIRRCVNPCCSPGKEHPQQTAYPRSQRTQSAPPSLRLPIHESLMFDRRLMQLPGKKARLTFRPKVLKKGRTPMQEAAQSTLSRRSLSDLGDLGTSQLRLLGLESAPACKGSSCCGASAVSAVPQEGHSLPASASHFNLFSEMANSQGSRLHGEESHIASKRRVVISSRLTLPTAHNSQPVDDAPVLTPFASRWQEYLQKLHGTRQWLMLAEGRWRRRTGSVSLPSPVIWR